ncbi:MAG: hypothetical protein ABI165_01730 [Bryobacteraceae bacterium]
MNLVLQQLNDARPVNIHGGIGRRLNVGAIFICDYPAVETVFLDNLGQGHTHVTIQRVEIVQGTARERAQFVGPALHGKIVLILGGDNRYVAAPHRDCYRSSNYWPIAGEEKNILRQSADKRVPMLLLEHVLNALYSFFVAGHIDAVTYWFFLRLHQIPAPAASAPAAITPAGTAEVRSSVV